MNSGYSKTSLFTLGYINEKVVDTKLYFNLISRIENISKIFEISPAPHKYNILNIVNKLYYKLRGHVNYILNQIYIKLFNKIYDKLSGTARSQKSITSSKIITEISLIMRLKSRVSIAPSRLRSNTQPNKYNIFLGYSRRLFLREAKLHTPYRNSFKDRCISNLYYSRRRKLIVLIKNNLYIFLKTSYI